MPDDDTREFTDAEMAELRDKIVRVPHKVRYSFDLASCVCGWHDVSLDQQRLHGWGAAHDEAYWGHYVELEEFVPIGRDDA